MKAFKHGSPYEYWRRIEAIERRVKRIAECIIIVSGMFAWSIILGALK